MKGTASSCCVARDTSGSGSLGSKRHSGAELMKNYLENGTEVPAPLISRRTFMLAAAATGGAEIVSPVGLALMGARGSANKIDRRRRQVESPINVVRRFCAAWSDNVGAAELAAFFTDDAVYHNIPMAPVTGREAIANNIASFIRPGPPGIEGIQFRVINIAANGPVMGTFEVSEGKISAWRDYFDMNQFTSRMG